MKKTLIVLCLIVLVLVSCGAASVSTDEAADRFVCEAMNKEVDRCIDKEAMIVCYVFYKTWVNDWGTSGIHCIPNFDMSPAGQSIFE